MRANRDNRKYHNAMQPTQPSKSKREARRLGVQRFCIESRDISARGVTKKNTCCCTTYYGIHAGHHGLGFEGDDKEEVFTPLPERHHHGNTAFSLFSQGISSHLI